MDSGYFCQLFGREAPRGGWRAGLLASLAALFACSGAPERKPEQEPIDSYVCGMTSQEGVGFHRFTERALPSLWRVVEDNERRRCWTEALTAVGHIGGPEAFVRLVSFIESRAATFALSEDMVHLQTAFQALAHLATDPSNRSGSQAVDFLVDGSDPTTWEKRAIDWRLDSVMKRELVRVLTASAVRAMAGLDDKRIRERLNILAVEAADRNAYRFKYRDSDPAVDVVGYLINLHVLPPGRVAYAMAGSLALMRDQADLPLKPEVSRLHALALDTFAKEQAWLAARRGEQAWLKAIADANALADLRLNGLHGQLRSLKDLRDGQRAKESIARVEDVIFPDGPLPVIESDFPEQVKFVLAACDALERRFAEELRYLNLVNHVKVTRAAHEALDRALRSGIGGQGFEEVLVARAKLQISLRVLVAGLIAAYPGSQPGDRARRDLVLGPVLNQNEQVAGFMARRVQVRDVDPGSGQELDPLEEGGAIDKSQTPGIGDPERLREKVRQQIREEEAKAP